MSQLTDRKRRFLEVLAEQDQPISPVRVHRLAYPDAPYRGRRDAGATRTLDSLQREHLASGRYPVYAAATGRQWEITDKGREALAAS